MKWCYKTPVAGDMIRVALEELYHVGIYVSDDEVIQFGLAPTATSLLKDSEIAVLSSDIDTFLSGGFLEVAEFDRKEKKKHRKPKDVVAYARSKIGTRGYNILYNNCEHFANECLSGEHLSSQADDVRAMFRNMPVVNVYLAQLPDRAIAEPLPCPQRNAEIAEISNEQVKREKYYVWKLLAYALEHSFGMKMGQMAFTKDENGGWHTEKVYFSLSHSQDALAVAVSRAPVGVDIEGKNHIYHDAMPQRIMTAKELAEYEALPENEKQDFFLKLWTVKEAIFKYSGADAFRPEKLEAASFSHKTMESIVGETTCLWSVATNTPERLRVYENISI